MSTIQRAIPLVPITRTRWWITFFTLLLLQPQPLLAGKVPYSPEQLRSLSTVIATGTVVAMEHRLIADNNGVLTRRWRATVRPDKVEKGTVPPGNLFFSYLTSGGGSIMVMCGPAQDPAPEIGDRVDRKSVV